MKRSSIVSPYERSIKVRQDNTRKDIILLASKLFTEKGYDRTSLRELAEAFGLSKGGLYHYVDSKDDILRMIIELTAEGENHWLEEIIEKTANLCPTEAVRYSIEQNLRLVDKWQDMYVFVNQIAVNLSKSDRRRLFEGFGRMVEYYENLLVRGVEAGEFVVENPKLSAFDILLLVSAWANRRWYLRKLYTLEEYTRLVTNLVLGQVGYRDPRKSTKGREDMLG